MEGCHTKVKEPSAHPTVFKEPLHMAPFFFQYSRIKRNGLATEWVIFIIQPHTTLLLLTCQTKCECCGKQTSISVLQRRSIQRSSECGTLGQLPRWATHCRKWRLHLNCLEDSCNVSTPCSRQPCPVLFSAGHISRFLTKLQSRSGAFIFYNQNLLRWQYFGNGYQ